MIGASMAFEFHMLDSQYLMARYVWYTVPLRCLNEIGLLHCSDA
jgi:hypothetical protein